MTPRDRERPRWPARVPDPAEVLEGPEALDRQEAQDADIVEAAEGHLRNGELSEAEALLLDVVSRTPALYRPEEERDGKLLVRQFSAGDYAAYAAYRRETGQDRPMQHVRSAYPRAYFHLGWLANERQDVQAALAALDTGLALFPGHARLLNEKAQALVRQRRMREALAVYRQVLLSTSFVAVADRAAALRGAAFVYVELAALEAAEAALTESLVLEPLSRVSQNELAYVKVVHQKARASRPAPTGAPRPGPHRFSHRNLPARLFAEDGLLGLLTGPGAQDLVADQWKRAHAETGTAETPAEGLCVSPHWVGGQHLVFLVTLPAPLEVGEASHVLFSSSPVIGCFVLERNQVPTLVELRADGSRRTLATLPTEDGRELLKSFGRLLSLPETVEPPTVGQLREGDPAGLPEPLDPSELARVQQADRDTAALLAKGDLATAEAKAREALDHRLARQGPERTHATRAHDPLVRALVGQKKLREAERACADWWWLCRRFRPVGDVETLHVLALMAATVRQEARVEEARSILAYRASLAAQARGKQSLEAQSARRDLEAAAAAFRPGGPGDGATGAAGGAPPA